MDRRTRERGGTKLTVVLMTAVIGVAGVKLANEKGLLQKLKMPAVGGAAAAPAPAATAPGELPVELRRSAEENCRSVLEALGRAVKAYEQKHGALPKRTEGDRSADEVMARLEGQGFFQWPQGVPRGGTICPGAISAERLAKTAAAATLGGDTRSYGGFEPLRADAAPAASPIAWDLFSTQHDQIGRNVLLRNGHVQFMREEIFQKILASAKSE